MVTLLLASREIHDHQNLSRVFLSFLGVLFLTCLISPWGAAGWDTLRSAIHFVRPAQIPPIKGFDPLLGFKPLAHTFVPFADPLGLFPGLFGLFLLGIVLRYAFVRTGSL